MSGTRATKPRLGWTNNWEATPERSVGEASWREKLFEVCQGQPLLRDEKGTEGNYSQVSKHILGDKRIYKAWSLTEHSPWKSMVPWKTILSFWEWAQFQGRTVQLLGVWILLFQRFEVPSSQHTFYRDLWLQWYLVIIVAYSQIFIIYARVNEQTWHPQKHWWFGF